MGQTLQAESCNGDWLPEVEAGQDVPEGEVLKVRVSANPDRVTFEVHSAAQHCLLCGDLGDEWKVAPEHAAALAAFHGQDNCFNGALEWRSQWIDGSQTLRTELRTAQTDPAAAAQTLLIDRQLLSADKMMIQLQISNKQETDAARHLYYRTTSRTTPGPAPIAFLREHGRPLTTLEDRIAALDKVGQLLKDGCEEISKAQEIDRVVPANFQGTVKMLLGGIAFYKGLLPDWMQPEPLEELVPDPLRAGIEAEWAIYNEPKGVCINIAPWNAPATLSMAPAVSMLAAGNHVVIKPPELVPNVSAAVRRLCQRYLSGYVWVEEGGKEVVERLISERADHLVFTGGGEIAKIVAARCGQVLTPVTLELGGKSPAFVDEGLDEEMLRSIVQEIFETKVYKTGQFCCAHDYVLIHDSIFSEFCHVFKAMVEDLGSRRNVQMLGQKQYETMRRLIKDCQAELIPPMGGEFDFHDEAMSVPMTGIISPSRERAVFQQEIFGPLLPIVRVRDVKEAIRIINQVAAKPLIAYCYTKDRSRQLEFINHVPAGNIAVNGGPMRLISNYAASIGGTGPSGTGASFWGRDGLKEFSNRKHVMCGRNGFARSFFSGPPA